MLFNAEPSLLLKYILKLHFKILFTELATQLCACFVVYLVHIHFLYLANEVIYITRMWEAEDNLKNQFSPSILWAPEFKLRSSGSAACSLPAT